ncbi:MAG: RICIN domain-containing protein, partial [Oscillospiraceae bacterium]|nr:RICIN domain-containing protein [Oscillospiraceae bacterium]
NAYFTAQKNASYAENISGTSFSDLYKYVAAGTPVVFNATMYMCAPTTGETWTTPDGKTVTWKRSEHCLVLIGYDKSAGTVTVADPLQGNVTYNASLVESRYNTLGKSAVIIHKSNEYKGETEKVESGSVYRIRNAASGLYLTVAGGADVNGTNVIQSADDGTLSQQFRISYDSATNSYRLYTMVSSNGTNRVVDIKKIGGWVVGGSNAQIYTPVDATAKTFVLEPQADGKMKIACRTNRNGCLAANGTSNGTSGGVYYSSAGNAVIQHFTGTNNQFWYLEKIG